MGGMPQLTQEQLAAIRSLRQASAPQEQAVNEARNALNAAVYTDKPDTADIQAKVQELAEAELAFALARAEAFAKLQTSENKLDLPPPLIMMFLDRRAGRGGFGGPGFGGGGGPGGPAGFGGPGGPRGGGGSQTPPIEGGFEWID